MAYKRKGDQQGQGKETGKPNPDQAEGSRENVEATLGDQRKDPLDQSEKAKGNVTVGKTPGKAEGTRRQGNSSLGDGQKQSGDGQKKRK